MALEFLKLIEINLFTQNVPSNTRNLALNLILTVKELASELILVMALVQMVLPN